MRLGLLAAVVYTTLSNSDLDAAYAAAYAAGDSLTYTSIGDLIVIRQAGLTGMLANLFGKPFPLFDAIQVTLGNFDASTAAPQAVVTAAGNVGDAAGNAITTAENAVSGIGGTLILALASAAVIAWVWHSDKK